MHPEIAHVNVFAGFSFADTRDTGVSFSAITFGDPESARAALRGLCEWTVENCELGNVVPPTLDDVLPRVLEHVRCGETPVALVEPSDNIGGGAPGDGTSVLRALINHQITNSGVILNDPAAVAMLRVTRRCERSFEHRRPRLRLAEGPVELDVDLVSLSNGKFELEDRHSHLASMSGVCRHGPAVVSSRHHHFADEQKDAPVSTWDNAQPGH
jgi:hypothetical protein